MTLRLRVDAARWRANQDAVLAEQPGLVPVAKGNGYGLGLPLLGDEARRLGVPTVAVGTAAEIEPLRRAYDGDVLVLEPWDPALGPVPEPDDRVVRTASSLDGLRGLAGHRVLVELLTSVRRFGLTTDELGQVAALLPAVRLEGFALHLPMERGDLPRPAEVEAGIARLWGANLDVERLWVSHLTSEELAEVRSHHPAMDLRARVGTRLWLGDRPALVARSVVLATHPMRRGERYGYRQRAAPGTGTLLVVGGGTAHGVGLEAPRQVRGLTQRAKVAAAGGLEATGRSLSPFHVAGKRRWYAEPPHMQVSLVWLPDDVEPPRVGDELDVDVRMTTTTFDEVLLEEHAVDEAAAAAD